MTTNDDPTLVRSQQGRRRTVGAVGTVGAGDVGRGTGFATPLVVTGDVELLDSVLAAAAAAGVEPTVTAEPASVRPLWAGAPLVVVGADRARQFAELALPHRAEVFVVGREDPAELMRWSAPLGAAVIGLPDGAGLLTAAIADVSSRPTGAGRLVAVVGGSGGAGASSVAAALAVNAALRGLRTMLVDLDPLGGGIDLLVGAEGVAGWRWPRLEAAQGHLGDLTGHLPRIAGLDVLSVGREEQAPGPGPEAVRAVLASAGRSHRLIVADLPRRLDSTATETLSRAELTLLVTVAEVRAVAAAQQLLPGLLETGTDVGLVVRRPRSGGVEARLVADALALPLAGTVGEDAALRQGAERGDPPGRVPRSPLGRLSRRLLDELDLEAHAA